MKNTRTNKKGVGWYLLKETLKAVGEFLLYAVLYIGAVIVMGFIYYWAVTISWVGTTILVGIGLFFALGVIAMIISVIDWFKMKYKEYSKQLG